MKCWDLSDLIGVVGAGDEQEDPGEGIFSRIRDLPRLRSCRRETCSLNNCNNRNTCHNRFRHEALTWWPEISQGDVDGEVSDLTKLIIKKTSSLTWDQLIMWS